MIYIPSPAVYLTVALTWYESHSSSEQGNKRWGHNSQWNSISVGLCWLDRQHYMTTEELWIHVITSDSRINVCQSVFQRETKEQRLNKWCNEGEISGVAPRNELWKSVQLFSENKDKLSLITYNNTPKRFIILRRSITLFKCCLGGTLEFTHKFRFVASC